MKCCHMLFTILILFYTRISLYSVLITKSQAITLNVNSWTDAGHAINQMYDILYMMDRDDIAVGVGGEGGISYDGTIFPDVGGYLSIIEQVL